MRAEGKKVFGDCGQTTLGSVWHLTLGMPHLADRGVSENWLYRECGHTHWELISSLLGLQSGQIVDYSGARLYASFVSTHLSGSLAPFGENETVHVESTLDPLSPKRFLSRHLVRGERGRVEVFMVSTFIKQKDRSDNRSFVSIPPQVSGLSRAKKQCELLDEHRRSRVLLEEDLGVAPRFSHVVVPTVDFNGARFLYFANFQEIDDRAYHFFTGHSGFHTIERSIHFYGNVNRSDTVEVFLCRHEEQLQMERTVTVLRRASDGGALAVMDTRRFVKE